LREIQDHFFEELYWKSLETRHFKFAFSKLVLFSCNISNIPIDLISEKTTKNYGQMNVIKEQNWINGFLEEAEKFLLNKYLPIDKITYLKQNKENLNLKFPFKINESNIHLKELKTFKFKITPIKIVT
jgi:hypothetical protein